MATDKRMSAEELTAYNKKVLQQAYNKVATGLKNLETPMLYKLYLEHIGKLQGQGLSNSILIHEQMGNATQLETYEDFQKKYGLQVNSNSTSIRIIKNNAYEMEVDKDVLDPTTGKIMRDEDGNAITKKAWITIPNFKAAAYFDISQTSGDKDKMPLPVIPSKEELLQSIEGLMGQPLSMISDMSALDQNTLATSAIQGLVSQQLTFKTDVFVKDKLGVTTRVPKTEAMQAFEKESAIYALCHHYGVAMDAGNVLGLARELDKSDGSQFKGLLESVHHTTMSTIKQLDGQYKSLVQEKNQGKEAPQKTSIMDKLSQNKDVILQKDQTNPTASKTKEMGLS
ncbi:hypothetical protein BMT55_08275 [Listeria newyorkensis]|uniref:Uncharacterized protein n=1 Tax=Listeria newyorkensis TaxID=1497681 RepID=A0ABX4XNS8_9LIST|nr:hypothetical protein [Listeria newyorkensis]PNP92555.1 hypothetical protein BMT55_08275 [Listeria newyorkensis]